MYCFENWLNKVIWLFFKENKNKDRVVSTRMLFSLKINFSKQSRVVVISQDLHLYIVKVYGKIEENNYLSKLGNFSENMNLGTPANEGNIFSCKRHLFLKIAE